MHVEDGVFFERVLMIARRQKHAEAMRISGIAGERLHQFADAAARVRVKVGMNIDRRSGGGDGEEVFPARPMRAVFTDEGGLEIKEWPLRFKGEFRSAAVH